MKTKEEKEADESREKVSSAFLLKKDFFPAALVIVLFLFAVSSASAAEYYVHEGESIQAAINMANPGDIITAHNGTYTENVVVNKSNLTIRSANGSAVTIVQSNRTDRHVFNITDQNNVTLEGFTIRDAGSVSAVGCSILALSLDYGSISVTSDPSGATVILDGQWGGLLPTTPFTLDYIEPGPHTVSLRLNGYEDWSKRVRVKAGKTRAVHATLKAIPTAGAISVTSVPSGATIGLDGAWYRMGTPNVIENVEPGPHTVSLRLNGYQDWSKRVRVKASETRAVHAILTAIPTTGSISVTSVPSGARIYLDNKREGKTPRTITDVPPGAHTIKLILDGYKDWLDDNVQVTADKTTPVDATLAPTTGSIKVTSDPSGATVCLDDDDWYLYETPCTITGVEPGDGHGLKITLKGYQDWLDDNVQVTADKTTHIHATLTPIPTTGSIYVTSKPSDAKIYLDNEYNGKTPYTITGVSPAHHAIKLTLVGYQDWSTNLQVKAGETTPVHATLIPIPTSGSIYVTSKPSDAKIYLDNEYNGKTPYTITGVSPAYHAIKLTLVGYQDWSANLQVKAGETSDVDAILIPCYIRAGIYMSNASNCVIKNSSIMDITNPGNCSATGIAVFNSSGNEIQDGEIINCGQGILIASGSDNRIERNIIRDNTIAGTGVRLESGAINTEIHENCFIDNVPQAWDDGRANNWIGNYWSQPPGGQGNYIIPGAAGSEDKDPLDKCPITQHE